jgi:hypothetical protein
MLRDGAPSARSSEARGFELVAHEASSLALMRNPRVILVLERLAIAVASLVLSVGLIAVLSGFFAGRDQAGVGGSATAVGLQFRDLGHAHLSPGELHPVYDSDPPTSGAHVPEAVVRDNATLNNDQLLEALESGDVVILYGTLAPPPGLQQLAQSVAGPFTPTLAAVGQAVILGRRPGTAGLIALAWTHLLRVSTPGDPSLRQFAQQLLGRGATGR